MYFIINTLTTYDSAKHVERTPNIGYDMETNSGRPFAYYTFGASCSEVEIDCLTGNHRVIKYSKCVFILMYECLYVCIRYFVPILLWILGRVSIQQSISARLKVVSFKDWVSSRSKSRSFSRYWTGHNSRSVQLQDPNCG